MKLDDPLFPPRVLYAWEIIEAALVHFFPVWVGLAMVLAMGA